MSAVDNRTAPLFDADLAGPVPVKPSRLHKYQAAHGVKALTVNIPAEVLAAFNEAAAKRGMSKNALIEKLIRTQLLRKR